MRNAECCRRKDYPDGAAGYRNRNREGFMDLASPRDNIAKVQSED